MQAFGYGNNTESEVLFGREKYFEVTKLTFAEDGTPTVYMKEVMKSGEADKGGETGIGDYRGRMPRGIPRAILSNREACPMFEQK